MSGGFRKEKHIFSQVALRHLFTFLRPVEITQMKTTSSLRVVVTQRKKNSLAPAGKAINAYGWNVTSFSVDTEPHAFQNMHNTKEYLHTFQSRFGRTKLCVNCFVHRYCLFSRIKSFPRNLCSRSSKNSSSVSKLDP